VIVCTPEGKERRGDVAADEERALADPEARVHHRRIDEDQDLLAARRARAVDDHDVVLDVPPCELLRVRDRRRGEDEDRVRAVERADPAQPAQDIRDIAPEHPAIGVELVQDDVAEVFEQLHPFRVVGEDPGVEHVRVRDDHVPGRADRRAGLRRGVAVIGVRLQVDRHLGRQPLELGELVLRQGLRREEIERARGGVFRDRIEDRKVVAERLPRGGRGDDDDVLPGMRRFQRGSLVGIERLDPACAERPRDPLVEPPGEWRVLRRARRDPLPAGHQLLELGVALESVQDLLEARACGKSNSRSHQTDDMERLFSGQGPGHVVGRMRRNGALPGVAGRPTACEDRRRGDDADPHERCEQGLEGTGSAVR